MKTLVRLSPRDRKEAIIKELQELIQRHRVIALADITGLRASQFQKLRVKLRGVAVVKVAKNTLVRRAVLNMAKAKPNIEKIVDLLSGGNAFVFTNESAFVLYKILERSKVTAKAKPGDKASRDVYIPAGNTGIPPGPILSVFKTLKVPTRIEEGAIHVAKDTLVLRKGDTIPREAADLLAKLGIEPIEVGLSIKAAYEDGVILTAKDLVLDIEAYRRQLAEAHSNALKLSIATYYPTVEVAPLILAKAHLEALSLGLRAAFPTREVVELMLKKAVAEASLLSSTLSLS
ncbi:MAG: 50S ribosomal protein L10 [Candidatus Nezhaarchaeota archaeon]|nr:50S ribosomal protein L10 [Candidatus Nezhaarchaeota archaeon]